VIRNIPIAVLLIVGFLISGLIPLLIVSLVSFNTTRDEMKGQVFRQLESVRNIKKEQLYAYYKERLADISVFAQDPTVIEAVDELEAAFKGGGGSAGGGFKGLSHENYLAPPSYKAVHDRYISFFKNLIVQHRYYDLFLLEPVDGETIFTVRKEADFGDRISEISSSLRDVWITAVNERRICLSDTRPYPPSNNIPAQFLAAPIYAGDELKGVIAVQISSEAVDDIMMERSGMWQTGETYLVGQDMKMRSDSYLDSLRHSVQASFNGTVEENGVDTIASREALRGLDGRKIITDYRGGRVLSAYTPVYLIDVRWALIAEVDEEEIDGQIAAALNLRLLTLTGFSVLLLLVLALSISALIHTGITSLIKQQERMIGDILRGRLETRAEPRSVGVDFQRVAARTNELLDAFVKQTQERRKLEEHIQRSQRLEAIGTLAGGIAHDLNNILTSMHAYAEIIRTTIPDDSFAEENLEQLVMTIRRASELVEQILTFSRRAKTEERHFNISDEIKESIKLFKATLPPNIRVEGDSVQEQLTIKANASEIRQVIMNLCTNAIQAMRASGGVLTITAEKAGSGEVTETIPGGGDFCRIRVRDTGHGMDEAVRERVFEPFFTTKPAGEGTGMGLSVVHGIVSKYGGAIEVESSPGKGSCFDVYLPLASETELRKVGKEPDPGLVRGEGHILFVDDDPQICDSQKKSLALLGYSVTVIQDSREAEVVFTGDPWKFDLLILDLSMPHMNGYDLAEKAIAIRSDVPIILTTGYAELADARRIEQSGFKSFILKPYKLNEISRLIAEIMKSVRGS
jgi:signal transduction histidine kinase/ActR/RegA family two-component response regulator